MNVVWVGVGGAVGAVARYLISGWAVARFGQSFPYGTLIVNVVGSFILGLVAALVAGRGDAGEPVRLFAGVGFCGAFTTFSTYATDTLSLAERSGTLPLVNVLANNGMCLAAALAGALVARLWST